MPRLFLACRLPLLACLAALLAPPLGGCENTVDPFAGRAFYSIRGYLDPGRTRQYIRVKDLSVPIVADTARTLDAVVTLENLTAGTSERLRDEVIVFGDNTVTHNFWTDTPVQPNATYRIRVERSDGAVTQATTTTPTAADPYVQPAEGHCLTFFNVVFEDARNLYATAVGYHYQGVVHWVPKRGALQYDGGDPYFRFVPENDLGPIVGLVDNPETRPIEVRCSRLTSGEVRIEYAYVSDNWSGRVNPGEPVDPSISESIENGIGFFGAVRQGTLSATVSTDVYVEE